MQRSMFPMLLSALLLGGCATMTKQETHEPPASATPQVSPALEAKTALPQGLKYKVAIGRFSNETRYGQSFFVDGENDRIGKQAMDILSNRLFETGRFLMLERADLAKIEKELQMDGGSSIKNRADFLILGSITEFGRKEVSDVGLFSRVKKQEAFAKVHIRIVDVATSQVIFAQEGKGSAYSEAGTVMGVGGKSGYDEQLNDKAIDAAISDLASNLIENLLERPWRGYILGYEEGSFLLSGGKSQNINVGSRFDVMQEGKKVKNPQTGMMITLPGKKIAALEVVALTGETPENEVSIATLAEGNLESYTKSGHFEGLYIQGAKQ